MILGRCWYWYCHRVIWPWQHYGFLTLTDGSRLTWHVGCRIASRVPR